MKVVFLITGGFLFLALLKLPIGYYTFLRILVTIVSIIAIKGEFNSSINVSIILLSIIAILFNPIFPIYLGDKSNWKIIDIISGIIFLIKSLYFKTKTNEK